MSEHLFEVSEANFTPLQNPGAPFPKTSKHYVLAGYNERSGYLRSKHPEAYRDHRPMPHWTLKTRFYMAMEANGYKFVQQDSRPWGLSRSWPNGGDFVEFQRDDVLVFFWFPLDSLGG